jgi:hypothetical protein
LLSELRQYIGLEGAETAMTLVELDLKDPMLSALPLSPKEIVTRSATLSPGACAVASSIVLKVAIGVKADMPAEYLKRC